MFLVLWTLTVAQRLVELLISVRNRARLGAQGFVSGESRAQFGLMVMVHIAWLLGALLENQLAPWKLPTGLLISAGSLWILAQAGRFWVLLTLGTHWNASVMQPGENTNDSFITSGPYSFVRHPNYLVVIVEFLTLPLVGGAVMTCVFGSLINGLVLAKRIKLEELGLFARPGYRELMGSRPRLVPRFSK